MSRRSFSCASGVLLLLGIVTIWVSREIRQSSIAFQETASGWRDLVARQARVAQAASMQNDTDKAFLMTEEALKSHSHAEASQIHADASRRDFWVWLTFGLIWLILGFYGIWIGIALGKPDAGGAT
jgi:hypothetical protein